MYAPDSNVRFDCSYSKRGKNHLLDYDLLKLKSHQFIMTLCLFEYCDQ